MYYRRMKRYWITALLLAVTSSAQLMKTSSMMSQKIKCNNNQTIERGQVCDGIIHCGDGSDEMYFGPGFKCLLARNDTTQKRRCVLPISLVNDDVIDCEDDRDTCFDSEQILIQSRCFRCLDGSNVISRTQVCDGIIDCKDLSDECICVDRYTAIKIWRNPICEKIRYSDALSLHADNIENHKCNIGEILCDSTKPKPNEHNSTEHDIINDEGAHKCLNPYQICDGNVDCPLGDDERYCSRDYICEGYKEKITIATFCDGRADCPNFDDECSPECWLSHDYCDNVINFQDSESMFQCSQTNETMVTDYVTADKVCNGVSDCGTNENDEASCSTSTHFYCMEEIRPLFVSWEQRFDGTLDCASGSDECGRMVMTTSESIMLRRDALVRSPFLIAIMWIMGCFALFGNAAVIWQTSSELVKDWDLQKLGKLATCNRVFVINLASSDFLMGLYLLIIEVETFASDGSHCIRDNLWRSSTTCVSLGFINQLSSQTSVLILLLMTSYRLYGTLNPFKVESSEVVPSSVITCGVMWAISATVATIPLLDAFIDYFTESYWFPVPFLAFDRSHENGLREAVIRMNTLKYNSTTNITDYSWTTMMKFFHDLNIQGVHPDWDYSEVIPFGYYNWYAICIPNLYPRQGDTAWKYATTVVIFNFCAFCYITIAYIIIYKTSSRPAVRKSVRKRSKQWRRDNKAMQKKIFLLVATDVACWFPICLMSILNLTGKIRIKRDAVDITGAILLPINSAINPLIYSSSLQQMFNIIKQKICPRKDINQFMLINSFREKKDCNSPDVNSIIQNNVKKKRAVRFLEHEDGIDHSSNGSLKFSTNDDNTPLQDAQTIPLVERASTSRSSDVDPTEDLAIQDDENELLDKNETESVFDHEIDNIVKRETQKPRNGNFWNNPITSTSFEIETSL